MKINISLTTNINSTSVAETILRKEYTKNEVKKQAFEKYGVPDFHVTITTIENAVMGLFTATGTFEISLIKYLKRKSFIFFMGYVWML